MRRRAVLAAALPLAVSGAATWAQGAAPALAWPAAPGARTLGALGARVSDELPDVQSAVALHRGALAFEYHRSGWSADSLFDTQSVTKSVLALLFGCALADGHVRGVSELVALRLPAMLRLGADARVQRLRFAHLLTMTAGWPADETARRDRDDDLAQLVRRPFVAEPGERFAYDNGAANLLALALAQAVGEPLGAYARRRLLEPLGITRFDWRSGAHGHALGALGLQLPTRAMARIGELVLAGGRWQGRALVPADYLQAATRRQNAGGPPQGSAYGYLWWVSAQRSRAGARPAVRASGYGGQWIHVDPALELVVAVASRRTPESAARGQGLMLIQRHIVPAMRRLA